MALTKATQNVLEGIVSTGSTGVSAGSFIVAQQYKITALGTTTQSQWNTIAGTTGQTYVVGSLFTAATIGIGSGNGAAAVARTLANRFADVVNVKDFGAIGNWNGTAGSDDTIFIQAAVTFCNTHNASLYWPVGTYNTTASIPNFWDIKHEGDGIIARETYKWYIEPRNDETNIIYISPEGGNVNDGFSPTQFVNIATAFNRIQSLGSEAQNGIWRLQFSAGTYDDNGLSFENLPYFKNKLQIYGASVDEITSVEPTTIWNGVGVTADYAIRIDASMYPSTSVFFEIKNIKFINWTRGGGIVAWAHGNGKFINIHTDYCKIGIWARYGYFKFKYGKIEHSSVWGIGVQYNAACNIGDLEDGGITFAHCGKAISIGRCAIGYIQGNTFSSTIGDCHISVEWLARVRPMKNTFDNTASLVIANGNSLFTDEVATADSNIFPASITEAKPYARSLAGSVIPDISKYSQKTLHNYSGVTLEQGVTPINLFSVTTTVEILLSDVMYGGPDFVPFRIPAYTLYSPTFELEISLGIALNTSAGGRLEFHGQGSANANEFCNLVIPPDSTYRNGFVKIRVFNMPNNTAARYEISYPPANLYKTGSTTSLNVSEIRNSSAAQLLYRLYWQSDTTDQVTMYSMRTYITE